MSIFNILSPNNTVDNTEWSNVVCNTLTCNTLTAGTIDIQNIETETITLTNPTNQIIIQPNGSGFSTTLNVNENPLENTIITIPDPGVPATTILLKDIEGDVQTVNSEIVINNGLTAENLVLVDTSDQITLDTGGAHNITISASGLYGQTTVYDLVDPATTKVNFVTSSQGAVTQITNINTAVTYNGPSLNITTVSAATPALSASEFVLNNNFITLSSIITLTRVNYTGTEFTNGIPYVYVNGFAAGSCNIILQNIHETNPLAGTVTISVLIS